MKIAFVCSNMESGKDGVGDYVSRLAVSLIQQGHYVVITAIHDYFVTEIVKESREIDGVVLKVLRLPSVFSANHRIENAVQWINSFDIDWLSLQYVGFGFNKFGLPIELLRLRKAISSPRFHIMFHELWCGTGEGAKAKEKFLGLLQKIAIQVMLKRLSPEKIFTNTQTSLNNLRRLGVEAKLTPVFSNIPMGDKGKEEEWIQMLESSGLSEVEKNPKDWLILGFFGTIYSYMDLDFLLQSAGAIAKKERKRLGLLAIGHSRSQKIKNIADRVEGATFWETGMISASLVDRAMKLVNIGVVTTRIDGLDKSGSAIAWLERGIPVIISPEDPTYKKDEMELKGIFQINIEEDILKSLKSRDRFQKENRFEVAQKAYLDLVV